ncbi:MAG: lytic murein transglycosylase B [Rhodocyclaceae bacterium]|nr:lytic murein transglycosylase B [Rhodocyclaceae bacterium]
MTRSLTLLLILLLALPVRAETYAGRDDVRAFIADLQARDGFDPDALATLFAATKPIAAVIKAILPPKDPAIRSWQTYRSRFVEPRRIAAGRRFWHLHARTLAQAEAKYGVPAEIILGIIGVETIYGQQTGRFNTFAALTTLAFDYPPRAELFRSELEALLLLARDEKRSPLAYQGSFAGALGLPQFLPSSLRQWGTDFDGDGRVDLTDAADAIGSVANFLKEHGWEKDGPVAFPALVNGDAPPPYDGSPPQALPADMPNVIAPHAPAQPAALVDFVTPDAPTSYCLGYHNFWVLMRYNRSSFYAMAVYDLAQALKAER